MRSFKKYLICVCVPILSFLLIAVAFLSASMIPMYGSSPAEGDLLTFSFEPKRIFIIGSSDEGESISFNLTMENRTDHTLTIEKLIIGFKKKGKLLLKKEQAESFFTHGPIIRERKIQPDSTVKWSAICLTSGSFGSVDEMEFSFRLKGRGKVRATQSFQIPVSRYLQKTSLRLPFKGPWKVTQGHRCMSNHRISGYGGDFAWDFAALGPKGNIAEPRYSEARENKYVFAFGREVIAPAAGKILKVKNDVQDNEGEKEYPRKSLDYETENPLWIFGNFIIIDHLNGEYSLLAHMMKGSIVVKEGADAKAGDTIGRCGNSGNTTIPHLHYQLMDGDFPKQYNVSGLPALFSNYTLLKPPSQYTDDLEPKNLFLSKEPVTNGDPEDGAIILAD